jgi:hypothetical protein
MSMVMRSPCVGDALEPPFWKFLIKLSVSLSPHSVRAGESVPPPELRQLLSCGLLLQDLQ